MTESNPAQVILTDDGIKIIKAQDTADNAAGGVTDLNDPNLMSVIEKQYNIAQFSGLTSQYNVILKRAKDASISTTDLTTAYTNLNAFMAAILTDTTKASDVDRKTYKSLTDDYNTALSNVQTALINSFNNDIDNMQSSVSVASQAASSAVIVASQAATTGDNANQAASQAAGAANQASADYKTLSSGVKDGSVVHITTKTVIDSAVIGTAEIVDAAITDAKVGDLSANKLTAGTIDFNTITGKNINASNITTGTMSADRLNVDKLSALSANLGDVTTGSLKGVDIVAKTFSTPNGSFTTDANGTITAKNMTLTGGTFSSPTINASTINGSTINATTFNTPTLNLGTNGILTTNFNLNQATSLYAPKKGTGRLRIGTGVINTSSDNMSRYSNTKGYWYGFDDNGSMIKNGTNHTGDDYAPGYEKHDIMKSNGNVLNRSYLDAMGLMLNEGGTQTFNTLLTAIGLETGNALLHKDLATNGTFEAALGTGGTYGFTIGSKVVAPMITANKITYSANMFISRHGYMALSTSTKANKLDIVDVPDMLQKGYNLLTLNPRQWFDKTSVEAYADVQAGNTDSVESVVDIKPVSGMVAEEVASAGLDDYVVKDENNKVQGLAYDRLWTLLLPVLRDMNDKINKLQKKAGI